MCHICTLVGQILTIRRFYQQQIAAIFACKSLLLKKQSLCYLAVKKKTAAPHLGVPLLSTLYFYQ